MVIVVEFFDLGICYIGGIRNDIEKVVELLNLLLFMIFVFGLIVGVLEYKN